MIYFISDLHIGHDKVILMDKRPFANMVEMTDKIIKRWNNTVNKRDDVYILGDMFWNTAHGLDVLPQLNGKLHLIKGNHDHVNMEMQQYFVEITDYKYLHIGDGRAVALSHYPIASFKGMRHGGLQLYGHVHETLEYVLYLKYKVDCRQFDIDIRSYNTGCMLDYMDYTPRTLDYILENAPTYEYLLLEDFMKRNKDKL